MVTKKVVLINPKTWVSIETANILLASQNIS